MFPFYDLPHDLKMGLVNSFETKIRHEKFERSFSNFPLICFNSIIERIITRMTV